MTRIALDAAVLDDGIENVNFFNGRVLTAEDMRDEQEAGAEHRRRIGRAHGPGVFAGLEAARGDDGRSVEVLPGLGVSWLGDVVELAEATTVALVVPCGRERERHRLAVCALHVTAVGRRGQRRRVLCIVHRADRGPARTRAGGGLRDRRRK